MLEMVIVEALKPLTSDFKVFQVQDSKSEQNT